MTTVDDFYRQILSWNFQALKEGRDQIPNVIKSPEDAAVDALLKSRPPLPDRFSTVAAYQAAYARPALQEFQAAAVQAAQAEGRQVDLVTVQLEDAGFVRGRGLAMVRAPADVPFKELRLSRKSREAPGKFPTEYLCVISNHIDPLKSTMSCLGISSYASKSTGCLAKLRIRADVVNMFAENSDWYASPLLHMVTFTREIEALASLDSRILLKEEVILGSPNSLATRPVDLMTLPPLILPERLRLAIENRLNLSQLQAIRLAVCAEPVQKFVLIKGPPGTGKTATIHTLLNCMHIKQYQEYYDAVAVSIKENRMSDNEKQWLDLTRLRPRFLVCAPSNVAIDNIVERIVSERFMDGQERQYDPTMVRVGSGASDSPLIAKFSLDRQVQKVLAKSVPQLSDKISRLTERMASHRIGVLNHRLRLIELARGTPHRFRVGWETRISQTGASTYAAYWVDHTTRSTAREIPPPAGPNEVPGPRLEEMEEWLINMGELTRHLELWEGLYWKMQRMQLAVTVVQKGFGSASEHFQLRDSLETMILNRATIVTATLSASGLPQVKATHPFQTLIVDEAAQAVELSTLIPLSLGVKQCVLVGDPQQLPATVLARRQDVGNYDRSLFERLENCGVRSVMLNVQYRMHPAISVFPNLVFYGDGLYNAPSVAVRPFFCEPQNGLEPLTFFDLVNAEESSGSSGSKSNAAEASFCVSLFLALLQMSILAGDQADILGRVGIITPYADQVKLIKSKLESVFPKMGIVGREVEVNTIDSFQGKEKDIIILSTVRADQSSLGFLADIRRMNVAITRAKHGLFVIGRRSTLAFNDYWNLLVDQAISLKKAYIPITDPNCDIIQLLAARDGRYQSLQMIDRKNRDWWRVFLIERRNEDAARKQAVFLG